MNIVSGKCEDLKKINKTTRHLARQKHKMKLKNSTIVTGNNQGIIFQRNLSKLFQKFNYGSKLGTAQDYILKPLTSHVSIFYFFIRILKYRIGEGWCSKWIADCSVLFIKLSDDDFFTTPDCSSDSSVAFMFYSYIMAPMPLTATF